MKTSTIVIRPRVPGAVGTPKEKQLKKQPVAKLIYGGVTIEISSELIRTLQSAISALCDSKCTELRMLQMISFGLEEIRIEMAMENEGRENCIPMVWFRDNAKKCSLEHPWNPLYLNTMSEFDKNHLEWDRKLKDHKNTRWETPWGKRRTAQ